MATLGELKALSAKALAAHHKYESRIKKLRERIKAKCPHEKTKIVPQSYLEVGRMASALLWEELVCCKCKKVLGTRAEQPKMSKWSLEEGVNKKVLTSIDPLVSSCRPHARPKVSPQPKKAKA